MHNGMRTILAATILIGALCALAASALATEPGENMLTNPGFEEGMKPWIPRTAAKCGPNHKIDNEVKHSGQASGRVDQNGYFYSPQLPIPERAWLHASFWAKVSEGDSTRPCIHFWQGKKPIANTHCGTVSGNEWKHYEFYAKAPEGAERASLALTFRGKGSAWYDDASLAVAAGSDAIFPNMGFEGGIAPWSPRTKKGFAENHKIDTDVKHGGKQSATIVNPGGYYYSPRFVVPAGSKVTVSYWAKVLGPTNGTSAIYLWRGKKPERIEGPHPSGNEWKQYTFSATVPAGVDEVMVGLQYFSKVKGQAWYDDVEISIEKP